MIVNACMYGETKGYLYLHMTDTNLGLVIYVITFFLVSKSHISAFLGVFGWGGGAKGEGGKASASSKFFQRHPMEFFFWGVERSSSFLRSYVGLGVSN